MQINNVPGGVPQTEGVQKPQAVTPGSGNANDAVAERRNDQVQISDAGRALSTDATSDNSDAQPLDPARADEIRSKILSGAYNSLAMAGDVARSILRSGDL